MHFYKLLNQYGFNAILNTIKENDIDGKMIKNLKHGMGISVKLLIKKELQKILTHLKTTQKQTSDLKKISYVCDNLIYNFEEKNKQIILNIQQDNQK